ncbi:M23 family metallopeptidase [Streptomyces sp. CC228A]|uniref:M23 family metallopeptidase n=1 Tax=Streptomyces sp. CC228A TaxID=2898186 RepID=UPI001F2008EA|nr:M23 family metallopeptidase [Streptomyces sp. CC228A]
MNRTLLATPLLLLTLAAAGPPPQAPAPPPPEQAARAAPRTGVWPLGPPRPRVLRAWQPPATPYGPGHRGIDLAAPPGTPVRAAAGGRITFSGPVGGRGTLAVTLPAPPGTTPLRTTYEPVRSLLPEGTAVTTGQVIATTTADPASHCAATCLHWGLRRGDTYLDPLALLPPGLLRRPPSRLLPLAADP